MHPAWDCWPSSLRPGNGPWNGSRWAPHPRTCIETKRKHLAKKAFRQERSFVCYPCHITPLISESCKPTWQLSIEASVPEVVEPEKVRPSAWHLTHERIESRIILDWSHHSSPSKRRSVVPSGVSSFIDCSSHVKTKFCVRLHDVDLNLP